LKSLQIEYGFVDASQLQLGSRDLQSSVYLLFGFASLQGVSLHGN